LLGVSEDAAQKRVTRAIEKLRSKLKTASTGGTASALTAYLSAVGATQVPATLTSRIVATAAGAAATSGLTGAQLLGVCEGFKDNPPQTLLASDSCRLQI
jgi:hypothetical protein